MDFTALQTKLEAERPESLREFPLRAVTWSAPAQIPVPFTSIQIGFKIKVDRYTTAAEKLWLKEAGFHFSGGRWYLIFPELQTCSI